MVFEREKIYEDGEVLQWLVQEEEYDGELRERERGKGEKEGERERERGEEQKEREERCQGCG